MQICRQSQKVVACNRHSRVIRMPDGKGHIVGRENWKLVRDGNTAKGAKGALVPDKRLSIETERGLRFKADRHFVRRTMQAPAIAGKLRPAQGLSNLDA